MHTTDIAVDSPLLADLLTFPLPLRPLLGRRLRPVGRGPRGGPAGEIPVCFGGVREEPVSQPAKQVWEAAAAPAVAAHRLLLRHRAALLRSSGGQNPHRDSDQRHAAVGQQLQLALHAPSIAVSTASAELRQEPPPPIPLPQYLKTC